METICVLGLGYIGLPTASILATNNFTVYGVDTNKNVVDTINQGRIHIKEPGLNTLVKAAVGSNSLICSQTPREADVFIIAVPTPINQEKADLKYVLESIESIIPFLKEGNLVIIESTIPPRTTRDIVIPLLEKTGLEIGRELFVTHCPERVLPGNILNELVNNNRIIGGFNRVSAEKAEELYSKIVEGKIILTDATSAEMAKLMENTFRDVNIALANELTKIAYDLKLDAHEVINLANMHPRVNLHKPGPGVGGHCLAVDPWFIIEKTKQAKIINLSRKINDSMPKFVVDRVLSLIKDKGKENPVVTVLGIAYKGNIDDTRESPATEIIAKLKEKNIDTKIFDPYVKNYKYETTCLEEAFKGSDLVLLLTDHKEYKYLAPNELGKLVRTKKVLDTRNLLNHSSWEEAGFEVELLGNYSENKKNKELD